MDQKEPIGAKSSMSGAQVVGFQNTRELMLEKTKLFIVHGKRFSLPNYR